MLDSRQEVNILLLSEEMPKWINKSYTLLQLIASAVALSLQIDYKL